MKIGIINRYYAPNPSITAESACAMARALTAVLPEARISVYHIETTYVGGVSDTKPVGQLVPMRPVYSGRRKTLRFLGNCIEGYRLARKAVSENDFVISMTDPPLINYWVGRICRKKFVPWVYWSLDLYPHAFVAAGLVRRSNIVYRLIERSWKQNLPSLLIALGEKQAEFVQSAFRERVPQVILPCGIQNVEPSHILPEWRKNDTRICFSYAGNIGEAHDADFLIDFFGCLDPAKHKAVVSVYGAKSDKVLSAARCNPAVETLRSMSRSDLGYVDVHLVTLLPEWSHICVPSKAVSAVCSGSTLLFHGDEGCDTWQMFRDAGWLIQKDTDRRRRKESIEKSLATISVESIGEKKMKALVLKKQLLDQESDAYNAVADCIRELCMSTDACKMQRHHQLRRFLRSLGTDCK